MRKALRLLALPASLAALGLGVAGPVHAEWAYGYAANNIKGGFVFAGVDTNGDGRPDAINSTAIQFGTPESLSSTSATLNGSGVSNSSILTPPDAPISATGSAAGRLNETLLMASGVGTALPVPHAPTGAAVPANTYYAPIGISGSSYSWGDAKIVSEQDILGTPIEARNAAESNVASTGAFADAQGANSSSTRLNLPILIGADCGDTLTCAVSFSFLADPYIMASLSAGALSGSVARGTLAFSITLTKVGDVIPTFAWAPNGAAGGIFGGTEVADAENLNLTREVLLGGDPDAVHSGPYASNGFGSFDAYTARLGVGQYTLSLVAIEKSDVSLLVPEPGALALTGLALSGLALSSRRRKQVA